MLEILKKLALIICFTFVYLVSSAQSIQVYPTHWWVGMKWNKVQLLIRSSDDNFSKQTVSINYPGITVTGKHTFENGKYAAVDITIAANAKPGNITIHFSNGSNFQWLLKARRKGSGTLYAQGVTSADFIYLIMPDRFSNGDPSNDKFSDMSDTESDR